MPMTLDQAKAKRDEQIDQNRSLGVVEYKSGEAQSDKVFEVTEGLKYLPGGKVLGPGQRFRPTERQIANGSLRGKARELTGTEYAAIRRDERRPVSAGADIGLRALPMTNHALKLALDSGLTEADFEGVQPAGHDDQYTKAQVEEIIANRRDLAA